MRHRLIGLFIGIFIAMVWPYSAYAQHEIKTADGIRVRMAIVKVEDIKRHV